MRPDAVTLLFKEAFDIFPPLDGKPTDDDLLTIREALLPILMVIPFDAVGGVHSLTALLMDEAKYATAHGGTKFVRPVRLPLYDVLIPDDAATVVRVRAEAAHKSKLEDYNNYEAAERGCAKFLRDVVDLLHTGYRPGNHDVSRLEQRRSSRCGYAVAANQHAPVLHAG